MRNTDILLLLGKKSPIKSLDLIGESPVFLATTLWSRVYLAELGERNTGMALVHLLQMLTFFTKFSFIFLNLCLFICCFFL
jgi:hypothetical protein